MRQAFIETLCRLAEKDERIWLLTGDLGYAVLERFRDCFPERFVNMGVAEQNMVGVATGLALCGKIVFTYSIANFAFMRCLEQIRNDACYHNANVKIVAVGGGIAYGPQGYTHHAVEDLAIMRALPNITVMAPDDPVETSLATQAVVERSGPCYLRLGKAGKPIVPLSSEFHVGKPIMVRDGTDVTLVSTGGTLPGAIEAADRLGRRGLQARVLSMHTLKPVDAESLLSMLSQAPVVVTIEEHNPSGGLGTVIAEALTCAVSRRIRLYRFGIDRVSAVPGGDSNLICDRTINAGTIADRVADAISGD